MGFSLTFTYENWAMHAYFHSPQIFIQTIRSIYYEKGPRYGGYGHHGIRNTFSDAHQMCLENGHGWLGLLPIKASDGYAPATTAQRSSLFDWRKLQQHFVPGFISCNGHFVAMLKTLFQNAKGACRLKKVRN